jgi:hypothetical protein
MPRIANTFFVAACSLFFQPAVRKYRQLDPDLYFRAWTSASKYFMDHFAVLGPFTQETARLLAVIPLFRFRETGEFCGARPFPAVFRCR